MPGSRKRRKPELVGSEDLSEITEILGLEFSKETIEPIERALTVLRDLRRTLLMPGVPKVTMRAATLHTILDEFRSNLRHKYDKVLYQAGITTGESFGDDLMNFLEENKLVPQDEEVLLNIWMLFEENADWGDFEGTVDESREKLEIVISDCFLSRDTSDDTLVHSQFLEGYIEAASWELFKRYPQMFRRALNLERPHIEPAKILADTARHDVWKYVIDLQAEELQSAFNRFYESKYALQEEQYGTCELRVRQALENAFREKAQIDPESRVDLPKLMKAFSDSKVQFDHRKAKNIYGSTSGGIHDREDGKRQRCEKLVRNTGKVLKQIELTTLSEEQKEEIADQIHLQKKAVAQS